MSSLHVVYFITCVSSLITILVKAVVANRTISHWTAFNYMKLDTPMITA